ncbi:hypothetical protein N0V85_008500 [Neurospora sp. IMI 360204]|nr:hypothetical protein N0V85_008500 [Neurospora sp. IMI 360204]
MPSRFITSVYTPLNINTNQPQYFRDYWDPHLGLTWYETASESDESSEERFSMAHGMESSMPSTVLRPPPTAAQGEGREAAGGLAPPPTRGGIAARRATARAQGPRYRLYPPSEIDTHPIGGRGSNQNRPILRNPEGNANGRLSNRFPSLGPFAPLNRDSEAFSIPSSSDPSTHYEPYTYLRSLRFFPRQQSPHPPPNPFDPAALNPFPDPSPYSPYSPNFNFPKPSPFSNANDDPSSPRHRHNLARFPFPAKKKSLCQHFVSPLLTLRLPAVWVATLQCSALVGSVAVISTLGPSLLASPPYNWTVSHSGLLLFSGALIGIILGGLYASVLADERTKAAVTGAGGQEEEEERYMYSEAEAEAEAGAGGEGEEGKRLKLKLKGG